MALIPKVGTITKYQVYYHGVFQGYSGDPGVAGNYGGSTTLYYIAEFETSGTGHWTGKTFTSYYTSESQAWEEYYTKFPKFPVSISYTEMADEISQAAAQKQMLESTTSQWSTESAFDVAVKSYEGLVSDIQTGLSETNKEIPVVQKPSGVSSLIILPIIGLAILIAYLFKGK